MEGVFTITGQIVDVVSGILQPGRIAISGGRIQEVTKLNTAPNRFILPGLIDAHVHIESSLLVPAEFARIAVIHGTVGCVSDPHEIGNVLGVQGVRYMIENGKTVPFYFCWGAPSCVPATELETAGATIGPKEIKDLLALPEVGYLAEMMNYPGVIMGQPEVMAKLALAKACGKPIDGHAPGVYGTELVKYIGSGISTDHECVSIAEGREKLERGMKLLIREGSAARNFDELIPLLGEFPEQIMFCSDDLHPSALIKGHINLLIARAEQKGIPFMSALRAATLNPIQHYKLNAGLLRVGDSADLIVVPDLSTMEVEATFIKGQEVSAEGKSNLRSQRVSLINNFERVAVYEKDIQLVARKSLLRVIGVTDGQIVTQEELLEPAVEEGLAVADLERDVLKVVVLNRYTPFSRPAVGFVRGFGLKKGAFASSVGHDSHNIVGIGTNDRDLITALNEVIRHKGAFAIAEGNETLALPLPVAGLMSDQSAEFVASREIEMDRVVKELGVTIQAPFTMLSFLSLLVVPHLKLSDRGLFSGDSFSYVDVFAD